jgi:hypothetical protein
MLLSITIYIYLQEKIINIAPEVTRHHIMNKSNIMYLHMYYGLFSNTNLSLISILQTNFKRVTSK